MNDESKSTTAADWLKSLMWSPLLWGGVMTVGFYVLIPHIPVYNKLLDQYFCQHPTEYTEGALFFLGLAALLLKAVRLRPEHAAFDRLLVDEDSFRNVMDPVAKADRLDDQRRSVSARFGSSLLASRVQEICSFVRGRRSGAGLDEHLKYLAELASEQLHGSYALVRTTTWAIPIVGFLGTVLGITIAIASLTPDQLESSLNQVTGGLAVAFDTTALALALSMILVFVSYFVERSEQRVLARVEDFGIHQLGRLFAPAMETDSPLAAAEAQAAQQLLTQTEALINWQTRMWQESIESLRQRWAETLETQQTSLAASLQHGMSATLAEHSGQLEAVRRESQLHMQHTLAGVSQAMADWQAELKANREAANAQILQLRDFGDSLRELAERGGELATLEQRLTNNLEAVRTSDAFEETLHNLTAAVHLLTGRAKQKAA